MKKLTSILLASVMALSLAACGNTTSESSSTAADTSSDTSSSAETSSEASPETASATGVETIEDGLLIMSTNAAFPPYEMTNDAGDFEGIDVEIAQAIADKLGLELRIDDMDFDSALLAAQTGKSDMVMAGVSVTEDRLVNLDFTDSYATGIQVVIVPEDSDIASVDDLANDKMIGVQRGTTGDLYCSDTVENGGTGAEPVTA